MSIKRNRPSRRDAERLLDDPAAHGSDLGTLLAAAAAPAQPDELRRGFALAGSADLPHIPFLPGQASDRATESVAKAPRPSSSAISSATRTGQSSATRGGQSSATGGPGKSGKPGTSGQPGKSASPSSSAPSSAPSASTSPSGSASTAPAPNPNVRGLCRAFQATDHSAHGSSLDSAAFTALAQAAAAAGAPDVATYCVGLIGEPRPTGKPSDHSTGKPTDHATGKPTDHSTGKPTEGSGDTT